MRIQVSRRIGEYLRASALHPIARVEWMREIKAGSLGAEIAARRDLAAQDTPEST